MLPFTLMFSGKLPLNERKLILEIYPFSTSTEPREMQEDFLRGPFAHFSHHTSRIISPVPRASLSSYGEVVHPEILEL